MNLKNKISLTVSLLFTFIYSISVSFIYIAFADFRQEEFELVLKEKAEVSMKLLLEMEKFDKQLLENLDQNSINQLYEEKTLIFDSDYKLIYSSLDDTKINYSIDELKRLKSSGNFFKKDGDKEIFGHYYDTENKDYYILISADDQLGKRKLAYLFYILIATYLASTALTWFVIYYWVKRLLHPLEIFHTQLKNINEHNLDTRVEVKKTKDEIDFLADEFNQMLIRIENSYRGQKEFASNASHELRTPIARITAKLENKIIKEQAMGATAVFEESVLNDINQLSELTNSLLLLTKMDSLHQFLLETCRLDEIIYETTEKLSKLYPDLKLDLVFNQVETLDLHGNKNLLSIAIFNLLKNAYLYSNSKHIKITLESDEQIIILRITNDGLTIDPSEESQLFTPFMRGQNAKEKSGLGLGLRIVDRIVSQHQGSISYSSHEGSINEFTLQFLLNNQPPKS